MPPIRVLFLCTGNSARSQMAEGLLRLLGGERFDVHSAGLEPKGVNPYAIQAMADLDYDLSTHRSKLLDEYLGQPSFDYMITVCSSAEEKCPFFPGQGTRLHWPFEDPAALQGAPEEILAKFREVRDQIRAKINRWISEI